MKRVLFFARWRGVVRPRLLPPAAESIGRLYPDAVEWWVVRAESEAAARKAIDETYALGSLSSAHTPRGREIARVIEHGIRPTKEAT